MNIGTKVILKVAVSIAEPGWSGKTISDVRNGRVTIRLQLKADCTPIPDLDAIVSIDDLMIGICGELLSVNEVSSMLKISKSSTYRLLKRGDFLYARNGVKYLIDKKSIKFNK